MEKNTLTTVDKLQIGDRFYKAGDRKKELWTKVEAQKKVTYFQTYVHWAKKDKEVHPQALKANSPVIFLRHALEDATG